MKSLIFIEKRLSWITLSCNLTQNLVNHAHYMVAGDGDEMYRVQMQRRETRFILTVVFPCNLLITNIKGQTKLKSRQVCLLLE